MDYSDTHLQILFDLQRFYRDCAVHYRHLERVADAYMVEYDKVTIELDKRQTIKVETNAK